MDVETSREHVVGLDHCLKVLSVQLDCSAHPHELRAFDNYVVVLQKIQMFQRLETEAVGYAGEKSSPPHRRVRE